MFDTSRRSVLAAAAAALALAGGAVAAHGEPSAGEALTGTGPAYATAEAAPAADLLGYHPCRRHPWRHCRHPRPHPRPTPSPTPTPSPSPTPSATPTPSPTPSPSVTPSPTPSPTPTPRPGWACTVPLGETCGAYAYPGIPNSNGYNTYVANQNVGGMPGTTETVYANDPGDWQVVADARPYGYTGVQTFPDVQQLFNNWCGGGWSGCASPTDTPIDALSSLWIDYAEESPTGPDDLYEFSPDLWLSNYGSDIMFWVDTKGRCNTGAFGGTVLGHATIGGQNWTVHRYGDAGAEIIFVLDGPGGSGTCAQQRSGAIDIKAGVAWLVAQGFVQRGPKVTQLNTGWEITSARAATFRVAGYRITAQPAPATAKGRS